jgi:fumarate hydratase subunit alpha
LREVEAERVTGAVRDLCIEANTRLPEDHLEALRRALDKEESALGREVLERLLENAGVARERCVAFCQDTGYAVFFVELGSEVRVVGGEIGEAIDEGVRRGYEEGYLRKSIVRGPLDRTNTGDNTPAVVYYDTVPGERLKLTMLVKGAGCDNMSALKMLTPAEGLPELERELLDAINATGIGPAGYGGRVTALAVHVESFPTHIAAFPVAVNLDCHSHRTSSIEL